MDNSNPLYVVMGVVGVLVAIIASMIGMNSSVSGDVDSVREQQRTELTSVREEHQRAIQEIKQDRLENRHHLEKIADLLNQNLQQAAYKSGRVDHQIEALEKQITGLDVSVQRLDVSLQREMDDVNATTEAKVMGMDTRIQAELENTTRILEGIIRDLRHSQEESRLSQITQRENIAGVLERLRHLETEGAQPPRPSSQNQLKNGPAGRDSGY